MKSILSELYKGNIYPEAQFSPESEEYREIHQRNFQNYEDFLETISKLDPSLAKQFGNLMDEQFAEHSFEYSAMFIGGFRLGARIMLEALQGDLF